MMNGSGWAARTTSPPTGRPATRRWPPYPDTVASVRANRAFLARSVKYLAALLASSPAGATAYIDADLRDTEAILG
jgi:S-adenosyl methyltransferase